MTINNCPFCKSPTDEVLFSEDYYAHVICRSCGACGPSVHTVEVEHPREQAILRWNSYLSEEKAQNRDLSTERAILESRKSYNRLNT